MLDNTNEEKKMFLRFKSWQDAVLTTGNMMFFIFLLPTVFAVEKPSIWTSIPTSMVLFIFTYTFFTLSFRYSALATFSAAITWLVLVFQAL